MKNFRKAYAFCATLALVTAMPAAAAPVVSSSAYGISADLSVAGVVGAHVGPLSASSGSAGADYAVHNSVATVNENLTLLANPLLSAHQTLHAGVLTSDAQGAAGANPAADASASIAHFSTALTSQALFVPVLTLLGLSADTIRSTSAVGSAGGLDATGSSTLAGLSLDGLGIAGLSIDGSLFVNPNANTVLVDILGLRIVLNEQIRTGDGLSALGIETNALHISFDNFLLGTNLLNGDVIAGHSQASITGYEPAAPAVPEPASWALMIAGFGLIGTALRRRHRRFVAA